MASRHRRKRTITLVVCGGKGRMGSRVAALARRDPRFIVGTTVNKNPGRGSVAAEDFPRALASGDVAIDFSAPSASVLFAESAARLRKPIVIGTTGLTRSQAARIRRCGRRTPVLLSPNMSPGVNLMFHLSRLAAASLRDYRISISETHHRFKKDRPSGTALKIVDSVRAGRKNAGRLTVSSKRTGNVVGEHTLVLTGPREDLTITHRAQSRDIFAQGALDAARWLYGKRPGFYQMSDVLGLP